MNTPPTSELILPIEGMTCASCVRRIERFLGKTPGVEEATFNLATETATVRYRPDGGAWRDGPSLKRPLMDYLHGFYADTAMFGGGPHATRCGLEFFGADQVVYATDTPLGPIAPTIKTVDALGLSDADLKKIFSGNAGKLLNMKFQ